jgi:hypothetical protein
MIKLTVTIDKEQGTAVFDWTGTGPQTLGNVSDCEPSCNGAVCAYSQMNCPISLSYAAIIYSLRSMINRKCTPHRYEFHDTRRKQTRRAQSSHLPIPPPCSPRQRTAHAQPTSLCRSTKASSTRSPTSSLPARSSTHPAKSL